MQSLSFLTCAFVASLIGLTKTKNRWLSLQCLHAGVLRCTRAPSTVKSPERPYAPAPANPTMV